MQALLTSLPGSQPPRVRSIPPDSGSDRGVLTAPFPTRSFTHALTHSLTH